MAVSYSLLGMALLPLNLIYSASGFMLHFHKAEKVSTQDLILSTCQQNTDFFILFQMVRQGQQILNRSKIKIRKGR